MLAENVVDRAIGQIVDGAPVDWPFLESSAQSDEERDQLRYLRIVGDIADLHRSTEAETRETDSSALTIALMPRPQPERHGQD